VSFCGDFEVKASAAVSARAEIFPVFVSCEIESGLENSDVCDIARTPFFPEPLGGGVRGLLSVSIRRERFGPVNYE
jgi:hypothetical protein